MYKKNIVIFDYWAVLGQKNLFFRKLDKSRYNFFLVHFGSISGNKEQPDSIDGIVCYEYSLFTRFRIAKVFSAVKPDLAILLNPDGLLDRSVIKYANKLGVTTLYIQHGLSWLHLGKERAKKLKGDKYKIKRYFKKFYQYFHYLSIYLITSLSVDKFYLLKGEYYRILYDAVADPIRFLNYFPVSSWTVPTRSIVYGNKDKKILNKLYGYPLETISVAGSLLFERYRSFFSSREENMKEKWLKERNLDCNKPIALLLPTINVEWGMPGCDENSFKKDLHKIYKKVTENNFNLVVKIHPRANESLYGDLDEKRGVFVTKDSDLLESIFFSDLVIAEPTTAIFPCILFRKLVLCILFNENHLHDFDFCGEGVAVPCRSENELFDHLKSYDYLKAGMDIEKYDRFLENYCNYGDVETSKVIANYIEDTLWKQITRKNVSHS